MTSLGERIEYAREVVVGRAVVSPTDLSKLSNTALRRVTRAAQKTLCHAPRTEANRDFTPSYGAW